MDASRTHGLSGDTTVPTPNVVLLPITAVAERTSISKSTIYKRVFGRDISAAGPHRRTQFAMGRHRNRRMDRASNRGATRHVDYAVGGSDIEPPLEGAGGRMVG